MDDIDEGTAVPKRQYRRRIIPADMPIEPDLPEVEVAPPAEAIPAETAPTEKPAKPPRDTSNDYGKWQFRPWKGMDHWVHAVNGRSTFNRTEAKKRRREE